MTYEALYLGEPCYNDDMDYPVKNDMIQMITQSILAGEYQIENQMNINEEDNQMNRC